MPIRHLFVAPLVSVALALTFASPAAAATTPAPSPSVSSGAAAPSDYTSLTSALMSMYAKESGSTLGKYLTSNQLMVDAAQGTSGQGQPGTGASLATGTPRAGSTALTASTSDELDAQLKSAGYTLDLRNYSNLHDLAADVVTKSNTADATVTLAGAQWVADLGAVRAPSLTTPTVSGATMPSIPAESLAFGLLMNQALAKTVQSAPDLFAQASAAGVGSSALSQVFTNQMLDAWNTSGQSLTNLLPNKCTGAMLAVTASGSADSAAQYTGCNPACTTGGLYLHNQASKAFDSSANQMGGQYENKLWSYDTLLGLQKWSATDLLTQNPSLVQGLTSEDGTAGNSAMCGAASQSATSALASTLPDIFSKLQVSK